MSTPPLLPGHDRSNGSTAPMPDHSPVESEIKQRTEEKAQEALEPASHYSAWKPWTWTAPTWLRWQQQSSSQQSIPLPENEEEEVDVERDDFNGESDFEDISEEFKEGDEFLYEVPTLEGDRKLDLLETDVRGDLEIAQHDSQAPGLISTAEKTDETSYSRLRSVLGTVGTTIKAVGSSAVKVGSALRSATTYVAKKGGKAALKAYTSYFVNKQDKVKLLSHAHQRMSEAGVGPQYIELSNFVSALLGGMVKDQIDDSIPLAPRAVKDLIDINIANGFANLAVQMKKNKDSIQNFDSQPALASMISLFVKKVETHIDPTRMKEVEERYREHRKEYAALLKKLFPSLSNEPEKKKILDEWIITGGDLSDHGRNVLFPEINELSDVELSDLDAEYCPESDLKNRFEDAKRLVSCIEIAHQRHLELKAIFMPVAEDILACFFPNKTHDIVVPFSGILNFPLIQDYFYNKGCDSLTEMLVKTYTPLENDVTRREGWEATIHARVGDVNIDGLIDAPASLLVNGAKNYIQTDPTVVDLVEEALSNALKKNKNSAKEEVKDYQSKEDMIAKMSYGQLASWIVESVQALLHTEDPHLLKAGSFIQGVLHHLTLALVAQGASLVISDGHLVEQNTFIQELVEGVIAKFKSLQAGESIPDQFWIDFTRQLPLPAEIIEFLTPKLIEQARSLQKALTESAPDILAIQSLHTAVVEKVQTYKGGDQLLSISQAMTDQVVEGIFAKNIDLAASSEMLGDTLEELFSVYLPDVEFDNTLKEWFKNNVSALGAREGEQETGSAVLLKQGVQTAILKALVNTIESNLKNDGEDYAVQFFKNIHQAFEKVFPELTEGQKVRIQTALGIQALIKSNERQIAEWREWVAAVPSHIEPAQLQLIQNCLEAAKRGVRAGNYIQNLTKEKLEIFKKLNANSTVVWNDGQLSHVREAIAFRQAIQPRLDIEKEAGGLTSDLAALESLRAKLKDERQNIQDLAERHPIEVQLEQCEVLIHLLELPKERLKWVSAALNIEKTREHAAKEREYILADLNQKEAKIIAESKKADLANAEAWKTACDWLQVAMDSQKKLNELAGVNKELTAELDTHLEVFRDLAQEVSALFGMDQKEKLQLPDPIQDKLWKAIEDVKQTQLPRLLFEQLAPMILPVIEADSNRKKLSRLGDGEGLLATLAQAAAKGLIKKIPDWMTSDKLLGQLDPLIASQLQAVLSGSDSAFQANQGLAERYIEGMLLSIFAKLAEVNGGEDSLETIAKKLKELIQNPAFIKGKSREEAAQLMINDLMENVLGIQSEREIPGIPTAFQKMAYDAIKEQAYLHLSPLLFPAIEKAKNRERVCQLSGSKIFANLAEAVSKDLFTWTPSIFEGLRHAATDFFVDRAGQETTSKELAEFSRQLADKLQEAAFPGGETLEHLSGFASDYVEGMILRLFMRIAEKNPPVDGKDSLIVLLENLLAVVERKYQEAKTPREIEGVQQLPGMILIGEELKDEIFNHILGIDSEDVLDGLPDPVKKQVYDLLKDQLGKWVLKIHEDVHTAERVISADTGNVREELKRFGVDQASHEAYATIMAKDIAQVVVNRAGPHILTESGSSGVRVVNQIAKGVEGYLEGLARSNLEVARVLLGYTRSPVLKEMLQEQLGRVASPAALSEEKEKAAHFVNDLVLINLNRLFAKAVEFEEAQGAQFNRKLMGNVLLVATNHIKTLNEAQKIAKAKGSAHSTQADYLAAAGKGLHPAVPTQLITFERSIKLINERLFGSLTIEQQARLKQELARLMKLENKGDLVFTHKILIEKIEKIRGEPLSKAAKKRIKKTEDRQSVRDVIREEANAYYQQRKDFFGDSATKMLMKGIFPNGKNDLNFIDEAVRRPVWKMLKRDLFPLAIQTIIGTILEESMLKEMISSALDTTLQTLNAQVELDLSVPEDSSQDQLDHVSGELMSAMIEMLELPAFIKERIKNPKTGEVNPSVKKALGASLRKQFDGQFIKKSLEKALKAAVKRDPLTGEPTIKFDLSSDAAKAAKREKRIAELDVTIKQQTYEVADASVTYFIRKTWTAAQYKFDQLVEKAFGKIGTKFKSALDAVFGFIFFKLIGTALGFLFTESGLEAWLRKKFHDLLSLDANRERILNGLTKIPEGQPVDTHVLANEDFVYKIAEIVQTTLEEALKPSLRSSVTLE